MTNLIILISGIIILFIPIFIIENIIFKRIKEKHLDFYNKLGKPSIWRTSIAHTRWNLLRGAHKLPNDSQLKKLINVYRIVFVIDFIIILLINYFI